MLSVRKIVAVKIVFDSVLIAGIIVAVKIMC